MKIDWDEVWFEWEGWFQKETHKRTKTCSECGRSSGGVILWEEQQDKFRRMIDKRLRTK